MAEESESWDAGHHKGLIARGLNKKPPAYYAEGNMMVAYGKAIGLAFVAIAPYYAVLDQLGSIRHSTFVPCSDVACHYMRIFSSENIPGSGVDFMSVQNGVDRPFHLDYLSFNSHPCPLNLTVRPYRAKLFGKTCQPMTEDEEEDFLRKHNNTAEAIANEDSKSNLFTTFSHYSFIVTKGPLWVFTIPFNMAAKWNPRWGMDKIPSGLCPGLTKEKMQDMCETDDMKNRAVNHLYKWGPSKIMTVVGLVGWALASAAHDMMLLKGVSEKKTLPVGGLATFMQGLAVAAVFCWAMASTEVFVAEVDGFDKSECMCFFRLPELTSLIALATPFALLAAFSAKVQLNGMAALFGDSLYYQLYVVPHYNAKQSFLWTWAVLTTPKMVGTVQGKVREKFDPADWRRLFVLQQGLFYWRLIVLNGFVALSAASFVVSMKELVLSMLLDDEQTAAVSFILKWVVMPLPSVLAWVFGLYAVFDTYQLVFQPDEEETFADQINNSFPDWMFGKAGKDRLKGTGMEKTISYAYFVVATTVFLVWTAAVAQGLCPDFAYLSGKEELRNPSLAQAELWGACGFIFIGVHVQRIISFVFSTWDDMESLKTLAQADDKTGALPGTSVQPLLG